VVEKNLMRVLQILIMRNRKESYSLQDLSRKWRVHLKTARRIDQMATRVTELLREMGIQLRF
jgi:hypothetical protein